MQLRPLTFYALAIVGGVLLLAALFIPWQSGSFFGIAIEPGLWNVQTAGFGGEETKPYSDYDLEDSTIFRLWVARVAAVVSVVGAVAAVVMVRRNPGRNTAFAIAGLAGLLELASVLTFEQAVQTAFDNADGFFSWTHGSNLAISSAVLLLVSAVTLLIPESLRLNVSR